MARIRTMAGIPRTADPVSQNVPPSPSEPERRTSRLGLAARDIERRLKLVDFGEQDLARVKAVRSAVVESTNRLTEYFFDYLGQFDEANALVRDPQILKEAKRRKREHLVAMLRGEYDIIYVEQRERLGMLYLKAGLDLQLFLGAFHVLMHRIGEEIMRRSIADPMAGFTSFISLKKVAFFDLAIIVDVLLDEQGRSIAA